MEELNVGGIISNGISRGLKNLLAIAVNFVLWILTIWIPYLNVGTTIGLFFGLALKSSRGEDISFTEIFNPDYRKFMGEIFLSGSLKGMATMFGFILLIIPGIVISVAWSQAEFLIIDKGINPLEAITKSNKLTYGKKWTIFGGVFVLSLITMGVVSLVSFLFGKINPVLGSIVGLIGMALSSSILLSANGYIYGNLTQE